MIRVPVGFQPQLSRSTSSDVADEAAPRHASRGRRLAPFFLAGVALLTGITPLARAADSPAKRPITLKECLGLALQHNFNVQIERYYPEMANDSLTGAYGAYDPTLHFNAVQGSVDQPIEFDPKKSGVDFPYVESTDSLGLGLNGWLPSGLTYDIRSQASYQSALTDFSSSPKDAFGFPFGRRQSSEYLTTTLLTLKQPLLRDFWIDSQRQKLWISKQNLKISELALRWLMANTVASVQQAYYELIFAREQVKVVEHARDLASQLLVETRRRVQVGDLPPLDERQAEAQVQTTQSELFAAQQAADDRQSALKNLITDDFRAWADAELTPAEALVAVSGFFDRSESWQTALKNRADFLQARLELERQGIVVKYQFNQLFPSLDLVGSYGAQGIDNSVEATLADVRDSQHPIYSYGVVLSIPLGNRAARGAYKSSLAAKKQAELRLRKMEQDILVDVDTAVKSAQSAYLRTASTRQARLYSEAALEAEQKKLQNGISTSFIVLELQQKLTAARTAEVRALADYNKALAQLALSEGRSLEKNDLSLEVK